MRSLRVRLVLLSTLISGVIILAFGVSGWVLTEKLLLESIDLRLGASLDRLLRELHPRSDLSGVVRNAEIVYGEDVEEGKTRLLIRDENRGEIIYQAPESDWLSQIDAEVPATPSPEQVVGGELEPAPEEPDGPREPEELLGRGKGNGKAKGSDPDLWLLLEESSPPPRRGKGKGGPGPSHPSFSGGMPPVSCYTVEIDGKNWRLGVLGDRGFLTVMALELSEYEAEVRQVRRLLFVAVPICLILIAFGGWIVANRALHPVATISETVSHITARGLDQRIPSGAGDYHEFHELVSVFNGMMDRLEKSFDHAVRFSADASHELKTPLAIMQGELSQALKKCAPGSEEEAALRVVSQECGRLKAITKSLMFLSQADAGRLGVNLELADLSREVEALGEDAEILCEGANLRFESDVEPGIEAKTDPVLLRQALENLVSNAVKFNEPGGWVRLKFGFGESAGKESGQPRRAVFSIENPGPGIPPEERERVFDRFFRSDKARGREVDGFGLGLNLAAEIVRVLGGELKLAEADAGHTRFEFILPVEGGE